jgi:hypothetical protein
MDTLVYTADITALDDPAVFEKLLGTVPAYRREKAMRFKFPSGRAQSLGVGLLLRLRAAMRVSPEPTRMWCLAKTENPLSATYPMSISIFRIPRLA